MTKVIFGIRVPYQSQKYVGYNNTTNERIYEPCIRQKDFSFELCDICGEQVIKGRLSRKLTTCSPKCNEKKWDIHNGLVIIKERNQKGIRPRSFWSVIRDECFKRDNYTCQKCFTPRFQKFFDYDPRYGTLPICHVINHNIHAHHIIPIQHGGDNNLTNLITLCEDCHKKEHSHNNNVKRRHVTLDKF